MNKTWYCVLVYMSVFAACGGGSTGGSLDAFQGVSDTSLDAGPPFVDTVLSSDDVKAGQMVTVSCEGRGFDPYDVEILVWRLEKQDEAVDAAEGIEPDAHAVEWTGGWTGQYPEGVVVENQVVKATRTGMYAVACRSLDPEMTDASPAPLTVGPGNAFRIETAVDTHQVKAGEWVEVSCQAWDVYGNEVDAGVVPVVDPLDGVTVSGLSVRLTKAVVHDVACAVEDSTIKDPTPEQVTVSANVPKKIYTKVTPETFKAGDAAEVECTATDFYDNPVSGLPISVYLPPQLAIEGKYITTTVAGMYPVKCVPQNVEWKYFQLHGVTVNVTPADPVLLNLKVVPQKEYYGTGESISVTATAVDEYDNLVPSAQVGVPQIEPDDGGIQPSPNNPNKTFLLKEEGVYLMTFRLLSAPQISADLTIKVEGSGPLLTILWPERGATIQGKPSVTVVGVVNDDVTGIKSLTINGDEVPASSIDPLTGEFEYLLNPVQGLNMIVAEVENGAGMKSSTMQSFQFSFVYYPVDANDPEKGMVHNSVRAFLGKEFFDDGVHDPTHPDDLATIIETFVDKLNINALIPSPVAESGPYKIYVKNIKFGKPTVAINLYDGGMAMDILIPNLSMDIQAKGSCKILFIDFCPDLSGDVTVDKIVVKAMVDVWTGQDKKVHAKMKDLQVALDGIDVDIDGILGDLFDWLIDWLVDQFADTIVKAVKDQLGNTIDQTIEDLFQKFELDQTIEIPPLLGNDPTNISILTRPQNVEIKADGADLSMEGTLYAPQGVAHDVLGSISRANCLKMSPPVFELPRESEIEFGVFDDLLNQGFYSVWWSGVLNATITSEDLGDVDLSQYGVSDLNVDLDFYLPPILTDCNPEGRLEVQVGDLYVDADLQFNGLPLHLGAFVYVIASAELGTVPNEEGGNDVAVTLVALDLFDLQIVSVNKEFEGAEDGLKAVIMDLVLPKLVEGIEGKTLATFPIPTIDLSTLVPDLAPGVVLDFAIEYLDRWDGFTVVAGHLE